MPKSDWTAADIRKLTQKGMKVNTNGADLDDAPRPTPAGIEFIEKILTENSVEFEKEYKFEKSRKWRFDFAIPSLMVGIEYDGLSGEKMLGHQTITGINKDQEKANFAVCSGWRILRYTAMSYPAFESDLIKILK